MNGAPKQLTTFTGSDISEMASAPSSSGDGDTPARGSSASGVPRRPVKRTKKRVTGERICQVCGDHAVSHNFGALTCETCKAFFRRNARRTSDVTPCSFENKCVMSKSTRRFCPCCRLNKCFSVGMDSSLILDEDEKKAMNVRRKMKLALQEQQRSQVVSSTIDSPSAGGISPTSAAATNGGDGIPHTQTSRFASSDHLLDNSAASATSRGGPGHTSLGVLMSVEQAQSCVPPYIDPAYNSSVSAGAQDVPEEEGPTFSGGTFVTGNLAQQQDQSPAAMDIPESPPLGSGFEFSPSMSPISAAISGFYGDESFELALRDLGNVPGDDGCSCSCSQTTPLLCGCGSDQQQTKKTATAAAAAAVAAATAPPSDVSSQSTSSVSPEDDSKGGSSGGGGGAQPATTATATAASCGGVDCSGSGPGSSLRFLAQGRQFRHVQREELTWDINMYCRLTSEERSLLTLLTNAYTEMHIVRRLDSQDEAHIDLQTQHDPVYVGYLMHILEVTLRKGVAFAKGVPDFRALPEADQIACLKASALDTYMIRSGVLFIIERNAWRTHKGEINAMEAKRRLREHHCMDMFREFCVAIKSVAQANSTLYALLHCLALFSVRDTVLEDRARVSGLKDKYLLLLKHYLEAEFSFLHAGRYMVELLALVEDMGSLRHQVMCFYRQFSAAFRPLVKEILTE